MKTNGFFIVLLASIMLAAALPLGVHTVDASLKTISIPADYPSIRGAVDAADIALWNNGGIENVMIAAGRWHTVGLRSDGTVVATGLNMGGQCDVSNWTAIRQVTAGEYHTIGMKTDGTVVDAGSNGVGAGNVSSWTNIEQVAAGWWHTVGVKSDGTVIATGNNEYGQCNVSNWTDIQQVAAGMDHTVGLRSNGTVITTAASLNVSNWTDIQQVTAGMWHTVGLRSDGTVVADGYYCCNQSDLDDWKDIQQLATGDSHIVGLRSNGTVIAIGNSDSFCFGKFNVDGWKGIHQVATGSCHIVGLIADGTVVATGGTVYSGQCDVGDWSSVQQVSTGWRHTVGLRTNGTVMATGQNDYGECNVGNWTSIQQVSAGSSRTVGLRTNGTVVVAGPPFDLSSWSEIQQVSAGWGYTVGLRFNGTVIANGCSVYDQCNIDSWKDIKQVNAGYQYFVGLRSDGVVLATRNEASPFFDDYGQCDVGNWSDIQQVVVGGWHTVGLKSDGTVVATGLNDYGQCDVGNWTDIQQVAVGMDHTVGLRSNGTVVATGQNYFGQCNVSSWTDLLQVDAGGWHTVGLRSDGTLISVGPDVILSEWDLIVEDPAPTAILDLTPFGDNVITSNCSVEIQPTGGGGNPVQGNVSYVCEVYCKNDPIPTRICPDDGPNCCEQTVNGTLNYHPNGIEWWPETGLLVSYFSSQVDKSEPFFADTIIDVAVNSTIGPLYVEGDLEIISSVNDAHATLNGQVYINGHLTIGGPKDFTLDLNGQAIFVEYDGEMPDEAIIVDQECIIEGSGSIITIGEIRFSPRLLLNEDDFIFLMSLEGSVSMQPSGEFWGSVAGADSVELQPGNIVGHRNPDEVGFEFPGGEVDITPPEVVSTSPGNGDTNVSVTTLVTATFNESIYEGTLVFTLDSVPGNVTYDEISHTATFIPDATLNYSTVYTANISATDLSGNPLPAPHVWSFATEVSLTPWDVNDDGCVDISDLVMVGQHWYETGPDGWIPEDINDDGVIDISDLVLVGQHWQEGCGG